MSEASGKHIVYIEDDPRTIDLVRIILKREHFNVTGITSGREGLKAIEETRPDLVLLDLMMPDMDGWEVFQAVRQNDALKDIPVIVITARAQSIDKVLGLHIAKVDDYITKPFAPAELLAAVNRVIKSRYSEAT